MSPSHEDLNYGAINYREEMDCYCCWPTEGWWMLCVVSNRWTLWQHSPMYCCIHLWLISAEFIAASSTVSQVLPINDVVTWSLRLVSWALSYRWLDVVWMWIVSLEWVYTTTTAYYQTRASSKNHRHLLYPQLIAVHCQAVHLCLLWSSSATHSTTFFPHLTGLCHALSTVHTQSYQVSSRGVFHQSGDLLGGLSLKWSVICRAGLSTVILLAVSVFHCAKCHYSATSWLLVYQRVLWLYHSR